MTLGATEAIYSAIQAVVGAGDEVIAFDPAYDSYEPAVRLAGGALRARAAHPAGLSLRLGAGARARHGAHAAGAVQQPAQSGLHHRQRGGPGGAGGARPRCGDILVLSDEVYEHVVFDGGQPSLGPAAPGAGARSFAVFSFGKTLHATGLRVGYCVAPRAADRGAAQGAPVQHLQHLAPAAARDRRPTWPRAPDSGARRWRPSSRPSATACAPRWRAPASCCPPAQGTYFQLLDFSAFAPADDLAFAERLLTEGGVATIPLSPFYEVPQPLPFVRLCIAKQDSTLDEAAVRLNALRARLGGAPR